MGSIVKRRRKDGSLSYRVQIRVERRGISHSESRTFRSLKHARAWERKREYELDQPGALEALVEYKPRLGELIEWYISTYRSVLRWGRNKQKTLEQIMRQPIADEIVADWSESRIVEYAQWRRAQGAGPSTVDNGLRWIGVVVKTARSHGYRVSPETVDQGRLAARNMGLTSASRRRSRRPSAVELERIAEVWRSLASTSKATVPMLDIMDFAIASARRRTEIVNLRWADNDADTMTGMVRDAKHPRHKWGNHKRFKYTKAAWEIMQRQPRIDERIFPYSGAAITARWVRACKLADVMDLRFHDLRHEATSRLFEAGGTITEVQQYTLHESWDMLRRYTQLRPEDVRQF